MTRTFRLIRDEDETGISGTGLVARGARFPDGTAVLHWAGEPFTTTTVHPGGVESILHIHGHGGKTRLVWDDDRLAPDFNEDDIELLHDILAMPDDTIIRIHERTRGVLGKVRAAMMKASVIPNQKSNS
jgi:hypothetical protein